MLGFNPISDAPISALSSGTKELFFSDIAGATENNGRTAVTPLDLSGLTDIAWPGLVSRSDSAGLVDSASVIRTYQLAISDSALPATPYSEQFYSWNKRATDSTGLTDQNTHDWPNYRTDSGILTDNVFIDGPAANYLISEPVGVTDYIIWGSAARVAATSAEVLTTGSPQARLAATAAEALIATVPPSASLAATALEVLVQMPYSSAFIGWGIQLK